MSIESKPFSFNIDNKVILLLSYMCPGINNVPGYCNSSPVDKTPTLGKSITDTSV